MSTSIPPDERLLDLVIALVNTPTRLTKEQVRATVAGYADAPTPDAFERMFERDKDTLRELGVPLLTVTDAGHGDDIGYRIDLEAYALPPVDLTSAELGVLSLAAQLWQDASLRVDSARALTKLRAAAPSAQSSDLVAGLAPRVRAGGAALGPLVDALHQRRAVRFTYRAATTGQVRDRHVEPWRLVARRGGWVLIGHDRDRGAARSFRLSRIEGTVRMVGPAEAFDPPAPVRLAEAERSWSLGAAGVARLALAPERAEALRARALPAEAAEPDVAAGRDVVQVAYRTSWELAEEVVGYGDAVLVLDPPEVRDAVLSLLRTAAGLGQVPRG
ncbi:MAG: WYL domain-containing protein [Actinobacteria bacterium]|nr:WYL domain-containing protein [Actinomycetota bacterium]MCG2800957.1 WYL domain-containing protein [Cellulomonas sp.]